MSYELEDGEGDGSFRRIRFTPTAQRKGIVEVWLRASDSEGNEYEERFQVSIQDLSQPVPVMTLQARFKNGDPEAIEVVLAWFGEYWVEVADDPAGPYEAIQEVESPATVEVGGDHRFFRVTPKH